MTRLDHSQNSFEFHDETIYLFVEGVVLREGQRLIE